MLFNDDFDSFHNLNHIRYRPACKGKISCPSRQLALISHGGNHDDLQTVTSEKAFFAFLPAMKS